MTKGLFITGTGTDVGKTFATGVLVKTLREAGVNCGYYKAALSGAERQGECLIPGDAAFVKEMANLTDAYEELVSYCYETAVSPHLAAQIEGNPVELSKVVQDYTTLSQRYSRILVEGSGGILCPIRWDEQRHWMLTDVIRTLNLPVLLISQSGLGSINNAVLTVSYCKAQGIDVRGIVMNQFHPEDKMEQDNKRMIETLTGIPVIGTIGEGQTTPDLAVARLIELFE